MNVMIIKFRSKYILRNTWLALYLFSIIAIPSAQQPVGPILNQKASAFRAVNVDMGEILERIAHGFHMPLGFERIPEDLEAPIRIELKEGTVRDLLDAVVKADPRYKWEARGSVINITPVMGNNSLLDVKIESFHLEKVTASEAVNALLKLNEVQSKISSMGLRRRETRSFPGDLPPVKTQRFSISLDNITLRDALNEIVQASGSNVWYFNVYGNEKEYFSMSIAERT